MADMVAFGRRRVTTEENFAAGHRACVGCAEALAVRLACKALGKDIIIAMATGCMEIVSSPLPWTSWRVPWIHTLFDNTAAVAAGIEAGLKIKEMKSRGSEKKIHVVAMGGDGATADIGLQALSGALERGHDMLYICFDNEGYMNTGIQRSSATPYGASTTTAPVGKHSIGQTTWKKNMPAIAAAHGIPYVATACPAYPFDLMDKVKKGAEIEGPAYVHILSPCPIGWRCPPAKSVYAGRLAVQTGVFPLYEIEDGKYKLNYTPLKLKPIEEYLKLQGRYKHLTAETIKIIQERVEKEYTELKHRVDSQKQVS